MKFYYQNPKTRDLIIIDSDANEVMVLSRVNVQAFTDDVVNERVGTVEKEITQHYRPKQKISKTRRVAITPEVVQKIKILKAEGKSVAMIAEETGISVPTIYAKLKEPNNFVKV